MGTPNIVFVSANGKNPAYYYANIVQTSSGTEGLFHPFTFKSGQSYTITATCAVNDASTLELYTANGLIQSFQTLTSNYCQGPVQTPTNKKLIGEVTNLGTAQLSQSAPYTFVADRDYAQFWMYVYPSGSSLGGAQISDIKICPNCFLGAPTGLGTSTNSTVLTWSLVTNAASYIINVTVNHSGTVTSSTLTSATNSVPYCPVSSGDIVSFTVASVCTNNGIGTTSSPYSFTYSAVALGTTSSLQYTPPSTLSWTGVPNATYYTVKVVGSGGTGVYGVSGTSVSGSSAELSTGQTYQVSVAANNSCVAGAFCNPITVVVPSCSPPTVSNVEGGTYINLYSVTNAVSYNVGWRNTSGVIVYQINNIGPIITTQGYQATGVPHGSFYVIAQANCTNGGTTAWGNPYFGGLQTTSIKSSLTTMNSTLESNDRLSYGKPGMSISPVPATTQINILFNTINIGQAEIMIISELGGQLMRKTFGISAGENNFSLNIGQLADGIYFVKLFDGKNIYVKKLVVQK